jgi:hypothetical protein
MILGVKHKNESKNENKLDLRKQLFSPITTPVQYFSSTANAAYN